jgi:hypothetical protein
VVEVVVVVELVEVVDGSGLPKRQTDMTDTHMWTWTCIGETKQYQFQIELLLKNNFTRELQGKSATQKQTSLHLPWAQESGLG